MEQLVPNQRCFIYNWTPKEYKPYIGLRDYVRLLEEILFSLGDLPVLHQNDKGKYKLLKQGPRIYEEHDHTGVLIP